MKTTEARLRERLAKMASELDSIEAAESADPQFAQTINHLKKRIEDQHKHYREKWLSITIALSEIISFFVRFNDEKEIVVRVPGPYRLWIYPAIAKIGDDWPWNELNPNLLVLYDKHLAALCEQMIIVIEQKLVNWKGSFESDTLATNIEAVLEKLREKIADQPNGT